MDYPGNLFVVAAPSGAGKSSLVKALLELDSHLVVSVSHTTRPPRGQEQHGREYLFVDEPTHSARWSRAASSSSGPRCTATATAPRARRSRSASPAARRDLEIDWQGALQIKRLFPNAVLIFILPPSWEELRSRLERRGEDAPEVIELRMANAARRDGAGPGIRLRYNQRVV